MAGIEPTPSESHVTGPRFCHNLSFPISSIPCLVNELSSKARHSPAKLKETILKRSKVHNWFASMGLPRVPSHKVDRLTQHCLLISMRAWTLFQQGRSTYKRQDKDQKGLTSTSETWFPCFIHFEEMLCEFLRHGVTWLVCWNTCQARQYCFPPNFQTFWLSQFPKP